MHINETFPAKEKAIEFDKTAPAGEKSDFTEAYLFFGGISKSKKIADGQDEVVFKGRNAALNLFGFIDVFVKSHFFDDTANKFCPERQFWLTTVFPVPLLCPIMHTRHDDHPRSYHRFHSLGRHND